MSSSLALQDLAALEAEAKKKAQLKVANLLQRPDQLEKVDQLRKSATKKKSSVEAMLKTAVQSQLDGVRTGMTQLHNALKDIKDIKQSLQEIDETYRSVANLSDKLTKVREENSTHSQLAAAVENLKHIFTVPEHVRKTEDLIGEGKLLHAHKCITDLEASRDDLLFELHKQQTQSPTDKNIVNHYFADVEKLSESLSKQLWLILNRTIMTVRREPTIIVTVLRIIEREERYLSSTDAGELLQLLTATSSWALVLILLLASLKLWQIYSTSSKDPSSILPLPPGSMGLPFIGETLSFIFQGSEFSRRRRQCHGNIFKTHILGKPTIRVIGSKNVRKVLMGEHNLVTSQWPTSTHKIMGSGALALSQGVLHRRRRRLMTKAFTKEALASYVAPTHNLVKEALSDWSQRGHVLAYPESKRLTFTVAAKVLLGLQFSDGEKMALLATFQDMANNLFSVPINIPGLGFYKGMKARHVLMSHLEKNLKKKAGLEKTDQQHEDVLSLLMAPDEDGDCLSPQELQEASIELLFAGHETTASAACSILLHLAKRPLVLEKLGDELHAAGLLGEIESSDLSYDVINRLSYTNDVIKEVLRVVPPIGGAFRKALKTFEIDGYQVPKGWSVIYAIRDTHESSEMWDDVDTFDPDRWQRPLGDNEGSNKGRFDFVPFGCGSRACIGREFAKLFLKIFLIELVRSYSWRLVKTDTKISYFPVSHPRDNMPVYFMEVGAFRRRAYTT